MPDVFNENGLQVKTLPELRADIETNLRQIYGENINLNQDTPDGQMVNIFAQSGIDVREAVSAAIASLDPDQAEGRVLDQRVALNGIIRKTGTYTMVNIDITTDRALNLQGLDDDLNNIDGTGYMVKDGIGNIFILAQSQTISAAGTFSFLFRARDIGTVQVMPNTITLPETIIAGVTAINNSQAVVSLGVNEESDAALKARRLSSFGISGAGQVINVESNLWALSGVTDVWVEENDTTGTVTGVPPNSIWCIVEGGVDAEIGKVIYRTKGAGCGTFGAITVPVTRDNGRIQNYNFDRPIYVPLYVKFDCGIIGGGLVNVADLKNYIVTNIKYTLNQISTSNDFVEIVKDFNSMYYTENMLISVDNTTWLQILNPDTPQQKYVLDVTNITVDSI